MRGRKCLRRGWPADLLGKWIIAGLFCRGAMPWAGLSRHSKFAFDFVTLWSWLDRY